MFSRSEVGRLAGHTHRMARADARLLERLAEPRTQGLRAWEYGTLLGYLQHTEERPSHALDVGAGDSAFPGYLVSSGHVGRITALDLPDSFEDRTKGDPQWAAAGIERLEGSMLDIPAEDASFDLVACISAIEHLDGHAARHRRDPGRYRKLPYDRYLEDTRTALREMVRVLCPSGVLYLTTDAYIPELQQTDAWAKSRSDGEIWSAYRFEDVKPVFVETLERSGLRLTGSPELDPETLKRDPGRSTFRGRYFTTFALVGRRST